MTNQTKYGVISDVHIDPRIVPTAISVLKSLGAEKLLVNGDIGNHQQTLEDSQGYVAFILDSIGKSGLESWVQPGSHESLLAYGPVMDHFSQKYGNVIDATKNQKGEQGDHHLVFLPGSDFLCGGEYQIGSSEEIPSGEYFVTMHDELLPCSTDKDELQRLNNLGKIKGAIHYSNMNDLRRLLTNPEKTVVVCHVPRKFDNIETCVDMAEFGLAEDNFGFLQVEYNTGKKGEVMYTPKDTPELIRAKLRILGVRKILGQSPIPNGSVFPLAVAQSLVEQGAPVSLKRENRGNEDLKTLYEELGVRKSVTGHFHESSHRANDRLGNHVNEGQLVNELFWNSGYLDTGHTGILTVDGEKVSYQNIRLQEHLK